MGRPAPIHPGLRKGYIAAIRKYGETFARQLITANWVSDAEWDALLVEAVE